MTNKIWVKPKLFSDSILATFSILLYFATTQILNIRNIKRVVSWRHCLFKKKLASSCSNTWKSALITAGRLVWLYISPVAAPAREMLLDMLAVQMNGRPCFSRFVQQNNIFVLLHFKTISSFLKCFFFFRSLLNAFLTAVWGLVFRRTSGIFYRYHLMYNIMYWEPKQKKTLSLWDGKGKEKQLHHCGINDMLPFFCG